MSKSRVSRQERKRKEERRNVNELSAYWHRLDLIRKVFQQRSTGLDRKSQKLSRASFRPVKKSSHRVSVPTLRSQKLCKAFYIHGGQTSTSERPNQAENLQDEVD